MSGKVGRIRESAARRRGGSGRFRRAGLLLAALGSIGGLLPAAPAAAAGDAVVAVTVSIVNPTTNQVITEVTPATMTQYAVKVSYSCNVADCTGVKVVLAPTLTDPNFGTHRREGAYAYTPPFPGAPTPTGTAATGITVPLGNITAGNGGSFTVTYTIDRGRDRISHASYFASGSLIRPEATITATNANVPGTGSATATWVNTIPTPLLSITRSVATVRPDAEATIGVTSYAQCHGRDVGGHVVGSPSLQCALAHEMVVDLPDRATYVTGSGGTYDPVARTVTFSATGDNARTVNWSYGASFKVTFADEDYPTSGEGCIADETFTATARTTYVSGTVKEPAPVNAVIEVQNCAPFAAASIDDKAITRTAGSATSPIVYVPEAGSADYAGYWVVTPRNRANVEGVATITEANLNQPDMPVNIIQVVAGTLGSIAYTLDDGTTGTTTTSPYTAPAGRRITEAVVTSGLLAGPNATPTDTAHTPFSVRFWFTVTSTATPGTRTNTATAVMRYPDHPELSEVALGPVSRTVTLQPTPTTPPPAETPPVLTTGGNAPTTVGGSTPVVGAEVSWATVGAVTNAPDVNTIVPQYAFVAPAGWDITDVTFNTAPPAGYTKELRTVTLAGKTRNAVVVTWPGPITIPASGTAPTLPTMTVKTKPTVAAPAGTNNNFADYFFADAANGEATYSPAQYVDAADIDGDGNTAEKFATRQRTASLAPTYLIDIDKEICRPKPNAPGDCDWIADSSVTVGVPPTASSIKYRVTIRNTGNAALNNVWAYDVLPYIGDTGTTTATASTQRGSTVQEVVSGVSDIGTGLTLAYSNSTNPSRPQVFSGSTAPDDWDATFAGASAIRARLTTLPAFESRSFVYEAALVGGSADKIACNSVAVVADTLTPLEPAAVCATTQEADFRIEPAARFPLQEGRVGSVPFVVTNGGASLNAAGTVTLEIPAGLSLGDLTVSGWKCTAPSTAGPSTVTCIPVKPDGTSRPLAKDASETITLEVTADSGIAGSVICIDASVDGLMHDPDPSDNQREICSTVVAAAAVPLSVVKDDQRTLVAPGETYTYTVQVDSHLVAESINGIVVTDVLPPNAEFVSADAGGTIAGQNGDGTGGTVTWNVGALNPVGVSNLAGDGLTGGPGSGQTLTVTVRAAPTATGTLENHATVSAPDPDGSGTFTAADDDIDTVQLAAISLTKSASKPVVTTIGEAVTYTFTIRNDGNVPLANVVLADPMPGLSAPTCAAGPQPLALAAGADTTCTATYSATANDFVAGEIVNTATVSGDPTIGPRITSAPASARVVAAAAPHLTLTKTAPPGTFDAAGDEIEFEFTVLNDGNVPLNSLTVADQLPGTSPVVCAATSLAAGASTTCSTTYTATVADMDAGEITNRATATALTAGGAPTTSAVAEVTMPADRSAALTFTKTAQETSFVNADTTLHYRLVVTNTGNVTLTNVVVTDPLAGATVSCPSDDGTLLPGASQTCTATYVTDQDDVDAGRVDNEATVTASSTDPDNPTLTAQASWTVDAELQPALSIVKTVDPQVVTEAGQELTYSFLVTNTGNVTLDSVHVIDNFDGHIETLPVDCPLTTLAPGTSTTCTAEYTVSQDDLDDVDQLKNTARAMGTPPIGSPVLSAPDSAAIPPVVAPSLTLTKEAEPRSFDAVGTPIEFTFTVTNSGNMTLSGVAINDPLPGVSAPTCPSAPLAPGDSVTCDATYRTTQADIDNGGFTNTATATAKTAQGTAVTSALAEVEVEATQSKGATFGKSAVSGTYDAAGQTATFLFTIDNTGNTTLANIAIEDRLPGVSTVSCPASVLTPAAPPMQCSATYRVTQQDVDNGSVRNTATLTADTAAGPVEPLPAVYDLTATQLPALTVVKRTFATQFDGPGQTLDYDFTISNTGNVTITGIELTDPLVGADLDCPTDTDLAPGDAPIVCTATYTTTQVDVDAGKVDNTATVTGQDPDADTTPVSASSALVSVPSVRTPAISIVKDSDLPDERIAAADQAVQFTFAVTNDGNVTLENIGVTDDRTGVSSVECPATSLAPSNSMTCSATYTTTQDDVDDAGFVNTATVNAATTYGEPLRETDTLTLTAAQNAALSLLKDVDEATYDAAGDVLHYTFTVTNEGNVTLDGLVIDDELAGLSPIDCADPELAPGDTVECTATYTVTQADMDAGVIVNVATATADSPQGDDDVTSAPAHAESTGEQSAAIALVKSAAEQSFAAVGDVLHYTFHVTNTGNVTLTDVTVSDELAGLSAIECADTDLAPGESVDCTATYSTTQADLDAGGVANTAIATGVPAVPAAEPAFVALAQPVAASAQSSVTVPAVQTPGVTLVKAVEETSFSVGSTLHFRFTVTNTGNVTIEDLAVNDPMPGLSAIECPTPTLAPGESTTCTATYVATQADVTAGRIVNTATAVGSTLNAAGLVSEPSTVEVAAVVTPPPPPPTTPPPTTPIDPGELPATGGGNLPRTIGLALGLLLAGLAIVELARRRRRSA